MFFFLSNIYNIKLTIEEDFNNRLNIHPEETLEYLYVRYYTSLCQRVFAITRDVDISEDIVQEIFVEIWKNKETIHVEGSLEAYLNKACRNRSLNFVKRHLMDYENESTLVNSSNETYEITDILIGQETEIAIQKIINRLPSKCKYIFNLSRFENLTYNEIAVKLDISPKTVEHQISKALKVLRNKLYKN